ncbi:MAG: response regulator [Candidatus Neomarinimicrobiota bacterium]
MSNTRGNIIWVDDEIDHLKPHIISLEDKGYTVTPISNGWDAITAMETNSYDLVLMDHFMPGIDGIETVRRIKELKPDLPIIMITKSEEEWLMDEAISEQVAEYLIKPVNPSQIFSACKRVLEKSRIIDQKTASDYLKEFREIETRIQEFMTIDDWWEYYNKLVGWQLIFDTQHHSELAGILDEQIHSCNREFIRFIESEYTGWLKSNDRPPLSPDILPRYCIPRLKRKEKVCLFVVDCLRYDHLMAILPNISHYFDIKMDYAVSILPTATPFARNSIFSGLFPTEIFTQYPEQKKLIANHDQHQNKFEEKFLRDLLKRNNLSNISSHYHKIWKAEAGQRFNNRLSDYMNHDLIAVVINFIDLLAHKRSESDIIKEMVPDETGYRQAVRNWFENSWFFESLIQLAESDYHVIITSDHGSVRVQRGVMVAADKETSSGVRYKYGRNLNSKDKNALVIKSPSLFKLPEIGPQSSYLIAKGDTYFLYPTQQHQYQSIYKDSFQHGGISMEEMLIPVATLKGK